LAVAVLAVLGHPEAVLRLTEQAVLTLHLAWLLLLLLAEAVRLEMVKALVQQGVLVLAVLVVLAALVHQDREILVEAGQTVRLTTVAVVVAVHLLSVQTGHQPLLAMVAQELHPQSLAHRLPMQAAAAVEPIKVELLVLAAQVAVEAAALAELTITELLELLTRVAVVVVALFKPTHLTGLVVKAALAL
jgi:hypothetical protein